MAFRPLTGLVLVPLFFTRVVLASVLISLSCDLFRLLEVQRCNELIELRLPIPSHVLVDANGVRIPVPAFFATAVTPFLAFGDQDCCVLADGACQVSNSLARGDDVIQRRDQGCCLIQVLAR